MSFRLKLNDEVYFPSKTNDILSVVVISENIACPVKLSKYPGTFTLEGLEFTSDKNPSIFPATVEWYNILKTAYPNLTPPTTSVKVLLIKKITEYYEIEIKESNSRRASNLAIEMLKDSTDGFKLIDTDSSVSLRDWEKRMIKITINPLELEKVKYQVTKKIMSDIKAINYYIDGIFIGTKLNEKDTIEFTANFNNGDEVQEVLNKYVIRYIKEEI